MKEPAFTPKDVIVPMREVECKHCGCSLLITKRKKDGQLIAFDADHPTNDCQYSGASTNVPPIEIAKFVL